MRLELDNNNISEIPSSVLNAKTLQGLFLSNNSLSSTPAAMFVNSQTKETTMLISLYVDGNQLEKYLGIFSTQLV